MGAATLAAALWHYLRPGRRGGQTPAVPLRNPFRLTASIRFALFFAGMMLLVELVRREMPAGGTYIVAALAGLTDVDAITLSMAEQARAGGAAEVAAGAIATAALSNTLVKCGIVVALGTRELKTRIAIATAVIVAVGAASLALG
jgi:uncharacterized membrane protein (DUF4010 family)